MKALLVSSILAIVLFACNENEKTSQQNIEEKIDTLIAQMTLEEKIDMIGGYKRFSIHPLPRLGIPEVVLADGPAGVRKYGPSVAYPACINTAASWDTLIAFNVGASIAAEAKAKNIHVMLGPGMNIYRAPMCSRNFEYLGEDPYLAGQLAASYIRGMQGNGVLATAKHLVANNQEYARTRISSDIDERTLFEIYLPAFRTCIQEADVACVMASYNPLNGVYTSENPYLLHDIVKEKWGFDGFIMSDWFSTHDVSAVTAGLDLEMPIAQHMNKEKLMPMLESGELSEAVIDDKIRRMLRMYFRFGLMEQATKQEAKMDLDALATVALEASRGGMVLLKNENQALPLNKKELKTLAVIGPNADNVMTGGGGSSFVTPRESVTILQGIKALAGEAVNVTFSSAITERFPDAFFENTVFEGEGLTGKFFQNTKLEGEPLTTMTAKKLNYIWDDSNAPAGLELYQYSARWTGRYTASASGTYYVAVCGDDGYRVLLDGKPVLDKWDNRGAHTNFTEMKLEQGKSYQVVVEHFQGGGGSMLQVGIGKKNDKDTFAEAVALAKAADAAIVCVGFNKDTETEGVDREFGLSQKQEELIRAVAAVNPRTIVVLNAGGNAAIANWVDKVSGLLHAWYPGQRGGQAVAEILFGDVNPSGKLPISIEKKWEDNAVFNSYYDPDGDNHVEYSEGLFVGYRHFDRGEVAPLFPFGYGLSYTTFAYSDLHVERIFSDTESVRVTLTVKNTGPVAGKEVVQLYVSDQESSLPRPVKELKAFAKIDLASGASGTVTMTLDSRAFAFYDPSKHDWVTEPGSFTILAGGSSADIQLKETIVLE